jgi:hypothetical protein
MNLLFLNGWKCEIKFFERVLHIDVFVNADDDIATSGVHTDGNIIDAALLEEDSGEDRDKYVAKKEPRNHH